ncbi:MAG: FAD-dependent oxidoreductase [Kibdelosporangium sp.]
MTRKISTDVCVVGGGPAGMAFALALAMRGDRVVVLEKSADFERSFRGESLSPDAVWLLQRLGVLARLRERQILEVAGTELAQDGETLMRVNFADYDADRLPIEVPQPMLLRTLADAAAVYPHFMLVRSAGATDLLRSGGKVTGVSARTPDGEIEVSARLTVGADGRYSNVLDWAGLAVRKVPMNRDALWFMVPCPDVWTNDTYRLRFAGAGHAICLPTSGGMVRVGLNIPKGGLRELRSAGVESLYAQVNALAPELAVGEHVKSWSDTAMLDIFTTAVPRWSAPGVIVIGDAAHAMSPALAQGINNAIVDGVTLAPMVSHALSKPGDSTALAQACSAFQQMREPQVARSRGLQLRQEKMFAWSSPPGRALRRTFYRLIDRRPGLKRRIWRDLYYTLSPPAEPARRPARST